MYFKLISTSTQYLMDIYFSLFLPNLMDIEYSFQMKITRYSKSSYSL